MIKISTAVIDVIGQEDYKEIAANIFMKPDGTILISDGTDAVIVTAQRPVVAR